MQVVEEFNANPAVHGILVQLPLPKHINEQQILDAISLDKDVDGFHPLNIGSLAMRGRQPKFISCTPKAWHPLDAPLPAMHLKWSTGDVTMATAALGVVPLRLPLLHLQGCMELLDRAGVQISGKRAVVVGRSNIVGTPVAMLLQNRDATVTVLHSRSQNAQEICLTADIVIAAVGKPEVVKADWVKPGAAVIDVGTNAVDVSLQTACLNIPFCSHV